MGGFTKLVKQATLTLSTASLLLPTATNNTTAIANMAIAFNASSTAFTCLLGYWCEKFASVGISEVNQSKITIKSGVWFYDGHSTRVGSGNSNESCDWSSLFCAGGNTFGQRSQQAVAVNEAIDNGGIHPEAPPSTLTPMPALTKAPTPASGAATCSLGYWCKKFASVGISLADQGKIKVESGVWFYEGRSTRIGTGDASADCDDSKLFCAGGATYGYSNQQVAAIKLAIDNGGVHPHAPVPTPAPTPSLTTIQTMTSSTVECLLGYWCEKFASVGISLTDQTKLSITSKVWFYDGTSTYIGTGRSGDACDGTIVFCAGGATYGYSSQQAAAIKLAIENGGVHPQAPVPTPAPTPSLTTIQTMTSSTVECLLGYWCEKFASVGISLTDQSKLSITSKVWFYDGTSTYIGTGGSGDACDGTIVFCAGGATYGYSSQQVAAIKLAIENGGVHPQAPSPTLGSTPAATTTTSTIMPIDKACLLGYWCDKFDLEGISAQDQAKITIKSGTWFYEGSSTFVGQGDHDQTCDSFIVFCAGGDTFGPGQLQAVAIKRAIDNGGIHPEAQLSLNARVKRSNSTSTTTAWNKTTSTTNSPTSMTATASITTTERQHSSSSQGALLNGHVDVEEGYLLQNVYYVIGIAMAAVSAFSSVCGYWLRWRRRGKRQQKPFLPLGKKYHFFVSHKKQHSALGNTSEHVSIFLHDALESLGMVGFLDIDDLERVSQNELKSAVRDSCVLLTCLNDETCSSEWCRLEWDEARKFEIPVLCVVDLRFNKQQILNNVACVNDHLLVYPWTEYTERTRRSVVTQVHAWIEDRLAEGDGCRAVHTSRAHTGDLSQAVSGWHSPAQSFSLASVPPDLEDGRCQVSCDISTRNKMVESTLASAATNGHLGVHQSRTSEVVKPVSSAELAFQDGSKKHNAAVLTRTSL